MKKILCTMLLGALIAGIAFAADISFTYTGAAIVRGNSRRLGRLAKNSNMTNSSADGGIDRYDCFDLVLSSDVAGVEFDWDIVDNSTYDNAFDLDTYRGWLIFNLPVGTLQITSGKWNSRYAARLKDAAGDLDDDYYETFKLGVIGGVDAGEDFAVDSDNLTRKAMSSVLEYTLEDVLPGKLIFDFGLVNSDYTDSAYDPSVEIDSGFAGRIAYEQEDVIAVNFDVKTMYKSQWVFGIFVSPLMVENLQATVGFTLGLDTREYTSNKKLDSEYDITVGGVDLRASYAFTEKLSVTTMHNFSFYDFGDAVYDDVHSDTKALWNMISVAYQAGDNIRFIGTVQNTNYDFNAKKGEANVFAISPMCEIDVTDKVNFTFAFDMRWDGTMPWADQGDVSLPIYLSFAL